MVIFTNFTFNETNSSISDIQPSFDDEFSLNDNMDPFNMTEPDKEVNPEERISVEPEERISVEEFANQFSALQLTQNYASDQQTTGYNNHSNVNLPTPDISVFNNQLNHQTNSTMGGEIDNNTSDFNPERPIPDISVFNI